jgi:hypothetical protein
MASGFIAIVAGFLVIAGLIGFASYLAAKKRREAFAAFAAGHGWAYAARDDDCLDQFSGAPFDAGHDRRAENVLSGTYDEHPFLAFDFRYSTTETSTDAQGHLRTSEEVHRYSVIGLGFGLRTPRLSVSPEGFMGRLFGRLTDTDIQLESEQFNDAFTVHCPDRKFATDVLHPQMMEYLLTQRDLAWSLRDGWLLTVTPGSHSLTTVETTLRGTDGIVERIPEFVWHEFGGEKP